MFEELLRQLEARRVYLDHLGQINEGKAWSATVRKKGSTAIGYGTGKNISVAVKAALTTIRDSFDPKVKPKKKRVRIR